MGVGIVYQGAEIRFSAPAAGDLSTKQYHFMKWSAGTLTTCDGATDVPVGVLQNKPSAAGRPAEVVAFGPSLVEADAALSQGDLIGTSADGQADKKIPGTDTTEYVAGRIVEAAGAAGDNVQAFINCVSPFRAA